MINVYAMLKKTGQTFTASGRVSSRQITALLVCLALLFTPAHPALAADYTQLKQNHPAYSSATGSPDNNNYRLHDSGTTFTVDPNISYTLSGVISGTGSLTKTGSGTLYLSNTANSYTGGTTVNAGTLKIEGYNSINPDSRITVTGTGSKLEGATDDIVFGNSGSGELVITNGGTVSTVNAAYIGAGANSSGIARVDGSDSLLNTGSKLYVGNSGHGVLELTNGGAVTSGDIYLGHNAGASGRIMVGTGSTLTANGNIYVGGNGTSATGQGLLAGTGTVTASGVNGVTVYSGSTISAGDAPGGIGTLTINGKLDLQKDATVQLDYSSGGAIDHIKASGNVTFGDSLNISLGSLAGGSIANASIITSTGGSLGAAPAGTLLLNGLALAGSRAEGSTLVLGKNAGGKELQLTLDVTGNENKYLSWNTGKTGNQDWDISSKNWTDNDNAGAAISFLDGDNVSFDIAEDTNITILGTQKTVAAMWATVAEGKSLSITGNILGDGAQSTLTGSGGYLLKDGLGSLALNGESYFTGNIWVNGGELAITGGSVKAGRTRLGEAAGSSGKLTVSGAGSLLDIGINGLYVGESGSGELAITGGGKVTAGYTFLGYAAGASGKLTVAGAGSLLDIGTNDLYVGQFGSGELAITGEGKVTAGYTSLGDAPGTSGKLRVDGAGSLLDIGTSSLSVGTKGSGELAITGGGSVKAGSTYLGSYADVSGKLTVAGAGSLLDLGTSSLSVGTNGSGELAITGEGKVTAGYTSLGDAPGASGKLRVDGAGSLLDLDTNRLYVGTKGSGELAITGEGKVTAGITYLGFATGASGKVTVDGAGSLLDIGSLYVGGNHLGVSVPAGSGELAITGEGKVTAGSTYLGYNAGASGKLRVDGTNSLLDLGSLYVGGNGLDASVPAGSGELAISGGGSVTAGDTYLGYNAGASGKLTVDGANSLLDIGTSSLRVGTEGSGELAITGEGSVKAGYTYLGQRPGASGKLRVEGAGSLLDIGTNFLYIGEGGSGELAITGEGKVTAGITRLGSHTGASGKLRVDGAGSLLDTQGQLLSIGSSGSGELLISDRGTVKAGDTYLGYAGGASGKLTVSGAGSAFTSSSNIYVGGKSDEARGSGLLAGTGTVTANGSTGVKVWGTGTISAGDAPGAIGTLTITGKLDLQKDATLNFDYKTGGSVAGTNHDHIAVNGDVSLGTGLDISLISLAGGSIAGPRTIITTTGGTMSGDPTGTLLLNGLALAGSRATGSVTLGKDATGKQLQITSLSITDNANKRLEWNTSKTGNQLWDLTSVNWADTRTEDPMKFLDGDLVLFANLTDDTTITIEGTQKTVAYMEANIKAGVTLTINGNIYADGTTGVYTTLDGLKGNLLKSNDGTLVLNGNNYFAGGIKVDAGTLRLLQAGAGGSEPVTISSNTAILELAFDGTFANKITSSDTDAGTVLVKPGAGKGVTLASNSSDYIGGTSIESGKLTLAHASAAGRGTVNVSDGSSLELAFDGTFNNAIKGTGALLVNPGAGNSVTLTSNSSNYTGGTSVASGSLSLAYASAAGTGPITIGAGNSLELAFDGTFANTIGGEGALFVDDLVTLSAANTYTGDTTVNATGALTITGSLGGGDYAGNIVNTGNLVFNQSTAQSLSGQISGAGSITKSGTGSLSLSGDSSLYGGTFTQSGGTIALAGKLGGTFEQNSGSLTSADGASLGNATFKGSVTPTGTLNVGAATFNNARLELGRLVDGNKIAASGAAKFTNNATINIDLAGAAQGSPYTLLTYGSAPDTDVTVNASNLGSRRGGMYFDTNALKYELLVNGAATLSWAGTGSNSWEDDDANQAVWKTADAKSIATWFKNSDNVIFGANAVAEDIEVDAVNGAGVSVGTMNVSGDYNFTGGQITASGAVDVAAGASLGLDITSKAPSLVADSVNFNDTGILNITGYAPSTGHPAGFSAPFLTNTTVISTNNGISGFKPENVTVANQPNADFLFATAKVDSNNVVLETGLRWYSTDIKHKARGTFTIEGATNSFTLGAALADNNTNRDVGWDGKILTKKGSGTLVLSAANTYTGGTTLEAGRINVGHNSALGTGGLTMASGTSLGFTTNNLSLANAITLNGTSSIDSLANTATLSGVISGTGSLAKAGTGSLTLSGVNSYSGGTTVNSGTLRLMNKDASGNGGVTVNSGATLELAFADTYANKISGAGKLLADAGVGKLILTNASNDYQGGTTLKSGTLSLTNKDASGGGTMTVNDTATLELAFAGTYANKISGAGKLLADAGAGKLTLTGANDYAGGTTVNRGTLSLNNLNAAGTGDVALAGGDLELAFAGTYANKISGAGKLLVEAGAGKLTLANASNDYQGGTTLKSGTLRLENAGATGADTGTVTIEAPGTLELAFAGLYANTISGSGSLTADAGADNTVILSKNNNGYSGNTTVNSGSLQLNHPGATGAGVVNLAAGSSLLLQFNGTYTNSITGSGDLQIDTPNTTDVVTLAGANTYSGLTIVAKGNLELGADLTQSSGLRLQDGASFNRNGKVHDLNGKSLIIVESGNKYDGKLDAAGAALSFLAGPGHDKQIPMLTVTGDADISGATASLGTYGGHSFNVGDSFSLLKAEGAGGIIGGTPGIGNGSDMLKVGATIVHNISLSSTANELSVTISSGGAASVQAKALSEGNLGRMVLGLQAADLIAGRGLESARRAGKAVVDGVVPSKLAGYAALSGGMLRSNSGSYVDMKSISTMVGLAYGVENTAGALTLGGFFEYGNGSYDTYNSFSSAASVDGSGDTHYFGAGLLGRLDLKDYGPGYPYLEGSLRLGKSYNEYDSSDLRNSAGRTTDYDTSSLYYGLHLGAGYVWSINDKASLDLYSKYFWTRSEGDSTSLSTGERVKFDDVDSHRLRLGTRFAYEASELVRPYVGAAYEYEFGGKAKATTNGYAIDTPELKGSTGIAEFGLSINPSKALPLSIDLGVQGYVGKREGVTGSLQFRFEF